MLAELLEEEVDEVVGPKGKHDPGRAAVRHGHESGEVTLGGRRVQVERPRVRSVNFYGRTLRELSKIEDYYQQAGEKRARLRYVEGMIIFGVVFVAVAAVLSAVFLSLFGLLHPTLPVCAGSMPAWQRACPLIGAVSGVVVSLLVQTSLVPINNESLSIEFFVVVAFLARLQRALDEGCPRRRDADRRENPTTTRTRRRRRADQADDHSRT